jgi:hypothetical protein
MKSAITANRLTDGAVLFLTAAETWSEKMADAGVATDQATEDRLLKAGQVSAEAQHVVDPYVVPLIEGQDEISPMDRRERIRGTGPTVQQEFNTRRHGSDVGAAAEKGR